MRKINMLITTSLLLFISSMALAAGDDFPGRSHKKYKAAPYMELADLYKQRKSVVIVDARSSFEFDTLRIKGAINIPVSLDTFADEVKELRAKTDKPLVFYCNGHTCMKSYKAVLKAMEVGVDNVFAYDAGIFDWTKAHPKHAELLDQSPVNLKHLISKKKLKARMLDPDSFADRATIDVSKSFVIDIRDKYQRAGIGFFPGMERWVSLNNMKKLYAYVEKAKKKNKTIYIYDEVGKQVRWLQYALERMGVKKYYFMQKGAKAYYKMIATAGP